VNSRSDKLTSERLLLLLQFMKGLTTGILRNNYLFIPRVSRNHSLHFKHSFLGWENLQPEECVTLRVRGARLMERILLSRKLVILHEITNISYIPHRQSFSFEPCWQKKGD